MAAFNKRIAARESRSRSVNHDDIIHDMSRS